MPESHPTRSRTRKLREVVITFRLKEEEANRLAKWHREHPVVAIKSPHHFARKVVLDFLAGQLLYLLPGAAQSNPTLKP